MRRLALISLRVFPCLALVVPLLSQAAAIAPERALQQATSAEFVNLRSIAGWLRHSDLLEARQRGFRNEDVLRIAQISADEKRDFLLFMVQRPDDQVYFYFSTLREGLKKAFVSIPSQNLVLPLDPLEAESRFRQEVRYWGERIEAK